MNDNSNNNNADFLTYQTNNLQRLIQEIVHCCDDRKLYESQKFAIPYAEIKCLMLFNGEHYLTVKKIAQTLEVAKSRVTKLIEGLESKGLVQSVSDPKDARVKLISLTQKGRKKIEDITDFQKSIHHKILEQFPEEERRNILLNLESLRSAMESVKSQFGIK